MPSIEMPNKWTEECQIAHDCIDYIWRGQLNRTKVVAPGALDIQYVSVNGTYKWIL